MGHAGHTGEVARYTGRTKGMKEIMMTIHTTSEGESAVTVNAKFLDHASAVRFHEGLSALVKQHSTKETEQSIFTPRWKLVGKQ